MIVCTSVCANYLPKALSLGRSIRAHEPGARFIICLVEERMPELGPFRDCFDEVILAKDLGIPRFEAFMFRHRILEAATAVKGHLFVHLLEREPAEDRLVYIDPDCLLFSPLIELGEVLDHHDVVLTPHLLSPGNVDMEISSLKHGVFNLGFLAIRRSATSEALVRWWAERLYRFCYEDVAAGLFTDQKWLNLAPCFFDVHILRHPGYNFATWNFLERKLSKRGETFYVDERFPLRFVHFSGYDGGTFDGCNRIWADPARQPLGVELSSIYRQHLDAFEPSNLGQTPWSYAFFADGTRIDDRARRLYRAVDRREDGFNPFEERKLLERMVRDRRWKSRFPRAYEAVRRVKNLVGRGDAVSGLPERGRS